METEMKGEEEDRFVVLAAVIALGGKGRKSEVLDWVAANGCLRLNEHDREPMGSRDEPYWRNALAFTRKHLVQKGYLSGVQHNQWQIIDAGRVYFQRLCTTIVNERFFERLAAEGVAHARNHLGNHRH